MFRGRYFRRLIFPFIFLYYALVSFLLIPSGDDYFWWGKTGMYLMKHNFTGTDSAIGGSSNGRYLGNLIEILVMHSPVFSVLFYALVMTTFLWCIYKLAGQTKLALIVALIFLFLTPFSFTHQVIYWYNGFTVYIPSITLLLLFCLLFQNLLSKNYSSKYVLG